MKHDGPRVAYSYIRFSHPDQARGNSLQRQTEAAADWCARNGVRLDTMTTLHDLGKSAYTGKHRENPDRNALAAFLKLVESGKVPRGSYLVIENLDRLSREHIQPALLLALNLLQAGVRIVQLKPAEMVFDDKSDTLPVMMMMMELSRGHGESAIKSERVGRAWGDKKQRARENGEVLTHRLPAWIEERDGRLHLIPERAAVVKRIFSMAANGYGLWSIVNRLTAEKVPAFGPSGKWTRTFVGSILRTRRVLGEHQPHRKRGRQPDGPPIANYFPAVVTEEEWLAARGDAALRRRKPGRVGPFVNVFAGLLRNALDGDSYCMVSRGGSVKWHKRPVRVLVNGDAHGGRATYRSFPYDPFERAILSLLAEVDPRQVTGKDDGPDEVMILSGRLAKVQAKKAEIEAELLNGDVASLAKVLRQLEAEERELAEQLAGARQKAAHPLSEAWGETVTLASALENAPDQNDARLRLRAALRRVVESIFVVVVRKGRHQLAACQVWFTGDGCRSYLILHRPLMAIPGVWRKDPQTSVVSLAEMITDAEGLDLRKVSHAKRLEKVLAAMELPAEIESGNGRAV
jgi:DNA invertase Pin-like site-specific DNA recombinase